MLVKLVQNIILLYLCSAPLFPVNVHCDALVAYHTHYVF